jgi:uncharacterized protein (TIGR00251 family)
MDPKQLLRKRAESGIIVVEAVPNSARNELVSFDEEKGHFKVRVNAPPAKGKANRELERFLSKVLGKKVRVVSGHAGRRKSLGVV